MTWSVLLTGVALASPIAESGPAGDVEATPAARLEPATGPGNAADAPAEGPDGGGGGGHTWALTLIGGYGVLAGPPSLGGYGVGRVVLDLGALSVDVAGREGFATAEARTVGSIFAGVRGGPSPWYLRGGFAHHHETAWERFLEVPVGSLAGVASDITHRSGLEAGFGVDMPVLEPLLDGRLGVVLDLSVGVLPDDAGSPVYVWFEQAWSIDAVR